VIDSQRACGMSGQFSSLFTNANIVVPQVILSLGMSAKYYFTMTLCSSTLTDYTSIQLANWQAISLLTEEFPQR